MTPPPANPPDVRISAASGLDELRAVAALFGEVWGRTPEGLPISSEMLRSLVHAGGLVSVARSGPDLVGAAVLGRDEPGSCYSYIAAVRPGTADHGLGTALKQHQRGWALDHGMTRMRWTFDPLVGRNARLNLTKLGAVARVYEHSFYGRMSDDLNGEDEADRLVPEWVLDSPRVERAAAGEPLEPGEPTLASGTEGPDGRVAAIVEGAVRWCRVPTDVVALRRTHPAEAASWRRFVREQLSTAFAEGFTAIGVSRSGWYRLENLENLENLDKEDA